MPAGAADCSPAGTSLCLCSCPLQPLSIVCIHRACFHVYTPRHVHVCVCMMYTAQVDTASATALLLGAHPNIVTAHLAVRDHYCIALLCSVPALAPSPDLPRLAGTLPSHMARTCVRHHSAHCRTQTSHVVKAALRPATMDT